MPVPITNFTIQDICDELEISYSSSIEDIFQSENVVEAGLDPIYCLNRADLITLPYNIGKWRNYEKVPVVNCGSQHTYPGGKAYPSITHINLGSGTGTVELIDFSPDAIPDRLIVEYNNQVVIDLGYRSLGRDTLYTYGGTSRSAFTSSLTGKIDPITGNTYPDFTLEAPDGYPLVFALNWTNAEFNKNLANITYATVKVYAPMDGTAWSFKLGCPA